MGINKRFYFVHRLVAAGFLPLPDTARWQVNHLDGDPSNNHVSNLQYVSPAENTQHSWQRNPARKGSGKPVMWRIMGQDAWRTCATQVQVASQMGISRSKISRCCGSLREDMVGPVPGTRYEVKWVDPPHKRRPITALDEEWRDAKHPDNKDLIPGLMVSNLGRVWNSLRGQVSQGSRDGDGYFTCSAGGRKLKVHRVVAASFLDQPDSRLDINHKDCDRGNNHVENLEYVTRSENARHSYLQRVGRQREPINCKPAQARRFSCKGPWLDFKSMQAASVHSGVSRWTISRICHGRSTQCRDWEFRFAVEEPLPGEEWRKVCPDVLERARATSGDTC